VSGQAQGLADALRTFGAEASHVEAKAAGQGLPASAKETLSAFATIPMGGYLIPGLDEQAGFRALGVSDPGRNLAGPEHESVGPSALSRHGQGR
jgi:hypothetical protein